MVCATCRPDIGPTWSVSVRAVSNESISSIKITAGWYSLAMANRARTCAITSYQRQSRPAFEEIGQLRLTVFSPSPTHFEVSEDAEMLKNVAPDFDAIAFPIIVFPVLLQCEVLQFVYSMNRERTLE